MPAGALGYHLNSLVTEIDSEKKTVKTANGLEVLYDSLVLATGSVPILPPWKGHNAKGVFVYRTVEDLEKMIAFSASKKGLGLPGVCVGGGLLGLEAAKAMMDLQAYEKVTVIETFKYLLARQVDSDGGAMIVEQVENLGVQVLLGKMVSEILEDEDHNVTGVKFNDGDEVPASCVCVAVSLTSYLFPANL
jgi:nitrite reductase (NAD(P)H)